MKRALVVVVIALGAAMACGREDVELVFGALDPDSGRPVGPLSRRDCDPSSPERRCIPLGEACAVAADCCSGRCEGAKCQPPGCDVAGAPCTNRARCCSGRCEPGASGASVCQNFCAPLGASCTGAQDCCSLACVGGACSVGLCRRRNEPCSTPAECCSSVCRGGQCGLADTLVCRASGEDCTQGGGEPCCGVCNDTTRRCDPGPGPCRATGSVCLLDSDCCRGACTSGVCQAPCLENGAGCATSAECCSRSCSAFPGRCGPPLACTPVGAACSRAGDCCSGFCVAGQCRAECALR